MERAWQSAGYLVSALTDARRRTCDLIRDLTEEQLRMPMLPTNNPVVWELGHVGWFQEHWVLRHARGEAPLLAHADSLYDSAAVAHDTRWDLPLPALKDTLHYLDSVLDRVVNGLESHSLTEQEAYFCWLAVMHEDMHGEALTYTRQTLGYAAPPSNGGSRPPESAPIPGDVEFPGGPFLLGANRNAGPVFDNEKWAHPVEVSPFAMARSAVTYGEFAALVDDGGYRRRELWTDAGWQWRAHAQANQPAYWVRDGRGWLIRLFDQVAPLSPDVALIHVNWYEADAYCRWANRRLPSEAEWELAASGGAKRAFPWGDAPPSPDRAHLDGGSTGCVSSAALSAGDTPEGIRQMIGNAWEWTASDFRPYPGFVRDPYKEYSEPWFGGHYKVLRGGCWATRSRLLRNTWRNFYTMDRRDVLAGFRTCAITL